MRRLYPTAAVGLGCALALAACGSSSNPSTTSSSNGHAIGIKYSDCMRSHGVPNFPDPSSGGGIQISSSSGINPASPAFQAAQKSCGSLLPGGGPGRGGTSETRKLALLHLAQCMRRHGFTTFPDPTSSPPSSPPAGGGIAFGGPGGFISVPSSMTQSPGFQQAASACGFPGAGGGVSKRISAG
ncbi:MAG TPA: hypothetical protein VMD48_10105 [Solirubrobacteraceae bacterium]|nr:hypothetical protein [Solirubrobacteraceae bacterium]